MGYTIDQGGGGGWGAGRSRAWLCAAAIVALSGCAGVRTQTRAMPGLAAAPQQVGSSIEPPAVAAPAPVAPVAPVAAEDPATVLKRVEAHVAERMPAQSASVHRAVAMSVVAESRRARVDPSLVLAVIHVESSFRPKARSRAGAKGLMQVRVPAVRQELKLGRAEARRVNAFDPAINVRVGTSYLRRMLDRFGDVKTALMAYNAGPNRLHRMLSRGRVPAAVRRYSRHVLEEVDQVRIALGIGPKPPPEAEGVAAGPSGPPRVSSIAME